MAFRIIDPSRTAMPTLEEFNAVSPFPWFDFAGLLDPDWFTELSREFPSLDLFELHRDLPRVGGQRPHNRYYLAYEKTIYTHLERTNKGIVRHDELPKPWQAFIEELNDPEYRAIIAELLGAHEFTARYAWHVGVTDSEVSPHRDSAMKLGTHIFYFNTDEDWDAAWGGEILALGGKQTRGDDPDFDDFTVVRSVPFLNNRSFLFKNTPDAWHGVKSLDCPEGRYRRLFNVIFEAPPRRRSLGTRLRKAASALFSRTQVSVSPSIRSRA